MPEISVVIVNWNGKQFLETCLSALRRQSFQDFETIFVDNGSEDGSVDYVRNEFPEVNVVALKQNVGFAPANNSGYGHSSGEVIVLLNNDTEAHPLWLAEIHRAVQEFPNAGMFACKMLYFDDRERIDNCGFALTSSGVCIDLGRDQRDGPNWADARSVFGACGGAAVYRRKMLQNIGFFDSSFFMTYEDVDLSLRAQMCGYSCVFIPRAIVYHRYRATMKKHPARQVFFSQRNIEFVYLKNMPFALMLRMLPERIVYELGAAAYFIKLGLGSVFIRAKFDVLKNLPDILRKRRQVQRKRALTSQELWLLMLRNNWISVKSKKLFSAWQSAPKAAQSKSESACHD